jgi:tetratricopeptide (TPR) repeat protein
VYALVKSGRYASALAGLGTLLEGGERGTSAARLQTALQEIAAIAPQAPDKGKAWRLTVLAVNAAVGTSPDYKFSFNALRYARELAPADERIKKLLDWFKSRHPELAGGDTITAGMTFLEYKRSLALDHLYGARYHEAIDTLNEVLALEPDDLVALKRLGSAYYSLGLYPKAREAWRRALALTPGDAQLKRFLNRLAARHPAPAD